MVLQRVALNEQNREQNGFESIHALFSSVSSSYDYMNDIMSMGMHHLWKSVLVDEIDWGIGAQPLTYVDMACGTGDVGLRLWQKARQHNIALQAVLVDPNERLLALAQDRAQSLGWKDDIRWIHADALNAPIAPDSVDIYTLSFGLRNMDQREAVLRRIWEQLRPGGGFYCLEFSHPQDAAFQRWYTLYLQWLPLLGKVFANNTQAYAYLRDSILAFPPAHELVEEYRRVGFKACFCQPMTHGVVAVTGGWKS